MVGKFETSTQLVSKSREKDKPVPIDHLKCNNNSVQCHMNVEFHIRVLHLSGLCETWSVLGTDHSCLKIKKTISLDVKAHRPGNRVIYSWVCSVGNYLQLFPLQIQA